MDNFNYYNYFNYCKITTEIFNYNDYLKAE